VARARPPLAGLRINPIPVRPTRAARHGACPRPRC
jgi:hypothetical protein